MHDDLRRARDILGMPVYSAAEGKRLGEVSGLYVRREDRTVPYVTVSSGALHHRRYLPFAAIRTIGDDTVMIEHEDQIEEHAPRGLDALDADLPGRPVLTESGRHLGAVRGFTVDAASGRIVAFRAAPKSGFLARLGIGHEEHVELPDEMVVSLGADALVVRDEAAALAEPEAEARDAPLAEEEPQALIPPA